MYQRNRVSVSGRYFALLEQASHWPGCWHSSKPISPTVGLGLCNHHQRIGCGSFSLGGRNPRRLWHVLTAKPCIVQGPPPAILRENKAICRSLGALPRQQRCAQANAETKGFDLHMTFHQHDLKQPALKPTQPEGISHEVPFVIAFTLWLASVRARDAVRESPQLASAMGLRADQTRVMKWVSAVMPSNPAAERRASMSSPM